MTFKLTYCDIQTALLGHSHLRQTRVCLRWSWFYGPMSGTSHWTVEPRSQFDVDLKSSTCTGTREARPGRPARHLSGRRAAPWLFSCTRAGLAWLRGRAWTQKGCPRSSAHRRSDVRVPDLSGHGCTVAECGPTATRCLAWSQSRKTVTPRKEYHQKF